MKALFRRKSEPNILVPQTQAQPSPSSVEQTRRYAHGPTSEFSAQVFYLGFRQIADSKSITDMLAAIRELKRRRKALRKQVDLSLIREVLVVREHLGAERLGAVLMETPLSHIAMCMQESRKSFGSEHFAVNVTVRGIAQQHFCHVFQANASNEAYHIVESIAYMFTQLGALCTRQRSKSEHTFEVDQRLTQTSSTPSPDVYPHVSLNSEDMFVGDSPPTTRIAPVQSPLSVSLTTINRPISGGLQSTLSASLGTVVEKGDTRHRTVSKAPSTGSTVSSSSYHSEDFADITENMPEVVARIILSNARLCKNCSLPSTSPKQDDFQAVLHAILKGRMDEVKYLLESFVPANGEDGNHHTLLHYAVAVDQPDAIQLLLSKGCRADHKDADGWTALHRASVKGSKEIVRILVENNADINVLDRWRSTPLHHCVHARKNHYLECIYALVEHGAKIDCQDYRGVRPVDSLPELQEMQNRLVASACTALASTLSQLTTHDEKLQPSVEVTELAEALEAANDSRQDPHAPPSTPADDTDCHYQNDLMAMGVMVKTHSRTLDSFRERDAWAKQITEARDAIKMLDETLQGVSGTPKPQTGRELRTNFLKVQDTSLSRELSIEEQMTQLIAREIDVLSRTNSGGESDMPKRPVSSRRPSTSKLPTTEEQTSAEDSPVKAAATSSSPVKEFDPLTEQANETGKEVEEETAKDTVAASSAILHLLYTLSQNPECHQELLAHLGLPVNAESLVQLAHMPELSKHDYNKIGHLLHNLFEVNGTSSRWLAMEAGLLNVLVAMVDSLPPLQTQCLNMLEDLVGVPSECRCPVQLAEVNIKPLLDVLPPPDTDSGIGHRRHFTPPPTGRRRPYSLDDLDGRGSSLSSMMESSHFARHTALRLLVMASNFEKIQRRLCHKRALLHFKDLLVDEPAHLVCLALECLANIAMRIESHQMIKQQKLPEAVRQFLTASNSPKHRYHAARLLIYLGQQHVNKVYLFDHRLVNALGYKSVAMETNDSTTPLRGATLERLVEMLTSNQTARLWGNQPLHVPNVSPDTATTLSTNQKTPAGRVKETSTGRVIDFVLCTLRTFVHPVLFMRLLVHRMHEPVTYDLFDWANEQLETHGASHGWSIESRSSLRAEHLYTMRVLELWLDQYPDVFVEFKVALTEVSELLEPMKRVGGPYMECYNRLKQLVKDIPKQKDRLPTMSPLAHNVPYHNELYAECQRSIVSGEQPSAEEAAVYLAALQIHIENISGVAPARRRLRRIRGEKSVAIKTKRCLPPEYSRSRAVFRKVRPMYEQLADRGLSERNAKHAYIKHCTQQPTYGGVCFKVKEKVPGRSKLARCILGLSTKRIVVLDDKTKSVRYNYPFVDIKRWVPAADNTAITFFLKDKQHHFFADSPLSVVEICRFLQRCAEELDWQQVRSLDNSPWSKKAEEEGLWGVDAVLAAAKTQVVRDMASGGSGGPHLTSPWTDLDAESNASDSDHHLDISVIPELRTDSSENALFATSFPGLSESPAELRRQHVSLDLAVKSTPRFSSLSPSSSLFSESLQSIPQSFPSHSPHLLPHRRRMFVPGPTPPSRRSTHLRSSTTIGESPRLTLRGLDSGISPSSFSSVASPLSPSLWGQTTLSRFQSMPSLSDSPAMHSRTDQHRYNDTFRTSTSRLSAGQSTLAMSTLSSTSSSTGFAIDKCTCPPDPDLPPDFSYVHVTALSLLDVPKELARQMTLIDHELFREVSHADLLQKVFPVKSYQVPSKELSDQSDQSQNTIGRCAQQFGRVSSFVAMTVLQEESLEERVEIIRQFITTAKYLHRFHNFGSMMAVLVGGLGSSAVHRLTKTWEAIPKQDMDVFTFLEGILSQKNNYKRYRETLQSSSAPAIPFIGLSMKDLTFCSEGNPDYLSGGLININKRKQVYTTFHQLRCFQQPHYNYKPIQAIQQFLLTHDTIDAEELHRLSRLREPPGSIRRDTSAPSVQRF